MAKLTEEQKAYWLYLISDSEAVTVEVEVAKDEPSEIEIEYKVEK